MNSETTTNFINIVKEYMLKSVCFSAYRINQIKFISLIYLNFSALLFFGTTMQTSYAVLFISVSVFAHILAWKIIKRGTECYVVPRYILYILMVSIAVVLLLVGCGAITGFQSGDVARSNAVLSDLVFYKWPVIYSSGGNISTLNYYLAYFLPPAFIGKLFGSLRIAEIATFFWSILGFYLGGMMMLLATKAQKAKIIWLFFGYSGLDVVGYTITHAGLFNGTMHLDHWARSIGQDFIANYQSMGTGLNWSLQHYIPIFIITFWLYLLLKEHKYHLILFLSVSLLFWSPIMTVSIVPYFIAFFIIEKCSIKKFFSLSDILSFVGIGIPMISYYLSMSLGKVGRVGNATVFRGIDWICNYWPIFILFVLIEFGILYFIIRESNVSSSFDYDDDKILKLSYYMMVVFLFIDYGAAHDFSMRASVIPWFMIFVYYARTYISANKSWKKYVVAYAVLATLSCCTEYSRCILGTYLSKGSPTRSIWADNTINESYLQYQYVGNPDATFFKRLCGVEDKKDMIYKEIIKPKNMVYSGNNFNIYFYDDYLYFQPISDNKNIHNIAMTYKYTNLKDFVVKNTINNLKVNFGILADKNIYSIRMADYSFNNLILNIDGEKAVNLSPSTLKKLHENLHRKAFTISALNDPNWQAGIRNDRLVMLIDRPSLDDIYLVGKDIGYHNQRIKIKEVKYEYQHTFVILSEPIKKIHKELYTVNIFE